MLLTAEGDEVETINLHCQYPKVVRARWRTRARRVVTFVVCSLLPCGDSSWGFILVLIEERCIAR